MTDKTVLDYTDEELAALSDDELLKLKEEAIFGAENSHIGQLSKKYLINSLYGANANKFFPLYNPEIAASITANGRYFIRKTADYVEAALQKVLPSPKPYTVYGDTDSTYFQVEPLVLQYKKKHPDATTDDCVDFVDVLFDKVIQPAIDKSIDDAVYDLNAYDRSRIQAKKELVADKAIWCAKKKYLARVLEDEGARFPVDNPHVKVMGLELAKSTTPSWVKEKLNYATGILFDKNESELRKWINDEVKPEYTSLPLAEISQVGAANRLDYDLNDKGVPILSRSAIVYNSYVTENNLEGEFSLIEPSNKFKYIRLCTPNPLKSDVCAYLDGKFAEKYLRKYVNYDEMFDKSFLKPLQLMCEGMGYDLFRKSEALTDW